MPYSTTFVDHMKHPSVKNHTQMRHLKAILAGRGGGGILNEPISCCLIKGFRITVLHRQFHFVFCLRFLSGYRFMQEPDNFIHVLARSYFPKAGNFSLLWFASRKSICQERCVTKSNKRCEVNALLFV